MGDPGRGYYGLQFHPEVTHTPQGAALLRAFAVDICGAAADWTPTNFIVEAIDELGDHGADVLLWSETVYPTTFGQPRNEVGAELDRVTINGTWNAPATVNGSGLPGSSDLRFGSTFDLDARLFVDLGRKEALVGKVPFLKGSRLSLKVDNLLDQRQRMRDQLRAQSSREDIKH